MIRLTAILSVVIFAAMAIISEDEPTANARQPKAVVIKYQQPTALPEQDQEPVRLAQNPFVKEATPTKNDVLATLPGTPVLGDIIDVNKAGTVLNEGFAAFNTNEISPADETIQIALIDPSLSPFTASIAEEEPAPLMVVTGNRVNVRSGPSTQNGVIGKLTRGDPAQLVEDMGNGWSKIRFGETARVGFMASNFLRDAP